MNQHNRHILHLLNRATFGPSPKSVRRFQKMTVEDAVDRLFENSAEMEPLSVVSLEKFAFIPEKTKKGNFKERRKLKRQMRGAKQRLNFFWLMEMAHNKTQLGERMAFFWHDHFACNIGNPTLVQNQINTLRSHALGYFGDLVVALSKDPAMINYLNSRQNVKDRPNENFGRELLELFTIGIGNYSEQDIKEASRAFTGYRYDDKGQFYLLDEDHDQGVKTFMGQSGHYKGEDIIDLILQNPKTGEYITGKLYYYLTGAVIDADKLQELSAYFYQSGYHIGKLVKKILTSADFYRDEIIGNKIKSPVELIAGMLRVTNSTPSKGSFTYMTQQSLKQKLLSPPNVSGWTTGKAWVDLSTIPERLKLAQLVLRSSLKVRSKSAQLSDEGGELVLDEIDKSVKITTNLKQLQRITRDKKSLKTVYKLVRILYTTDVSHLTELLDRMSDDLENEQLNFKGLLTNLLSLPEYQVH